MVWVVNTMHQPLYTGEKYGFPLYLEVYGQSQQLRFWQPLFVGVGLAVVYN